MKQILKWLKKHRACEDGYEWSEGFDNPAEWWNSFDRGDWMLWVICRIIDRKDDAHLRKITLAKARCAKLVLHLMKDERSRRAVEVAEQYGLGKATRQELAAAAAAYTGYAAAAAAAAATRREVLKECAEIVKELYSVEDVLDLLKGKNDEVFNKR